MSGAENQGILSLSPPETFRKRGFVTVLEGKGVVQATPFPSYDEAQVYCREILVGSGVTGKGVLETLSRWEAGKC